MGPLGRRREGMGVEAPGFGLDAMGPIGGSPPGVSRKLSGIRELESVTEFTDMTYPEGTYTSDCPLGFAIRSCPRGQATAKATSAR